MATTQFGGSIGPFLDRVQQRGVPVTVSGTCEWTPSGPVADPTGLEREVQARLVGAIHTVLSVKMGSGQLTFRNLGEGTLGDVDGEIIAQTGLQQLGVQLGGLTMRFAIDGGPPQREVRARIRVGGFTINASSKGGVDTASLGKQAIAKAKNALFWYVGFGLLALLIVGGVLLYLNHTVKKALNEPSASAKAAASWDGSKPLTCTGDDVVEVKGVTAKLDGAAVTASGGCKLTLVDVNITGETAIEANGGATVVVQGGSITGSKLAVHALGGAKVKLDKTKVTGKVQKLGGAEITGP